MKVYSELKSLGFFQWLDYEHGLEDNDMKPEYLDKLPLTAIHITVANAMAFRWFREKYGLNQYIEYIGASNQYQWHIKHFWGTFNTYEEAELECLKILIEIVKNNKS